MGSPPARATGSLEAITGPAPRQKKHHSRRRSDQSRPPRLYDRSHGGSAVAWGTPIAQPDHRMAMKADYKALQGDAIRTFG
jgi:hypothetical protein